MQGSNIVPVFVRLEQDLMIEESRIGRLVGKSALIACTSLGIGSFIEVRFAAEDAGG